MNTIQPRKQLIFNNTKSSINNLERLQEISNQLNPHFGSGCWNKHSMVTMNVGALSKLLYLNDLYQRIIDVPGVICEFGVQWGTTRE